MGQRQPHALLRPGRLGAAALPALPSHAGQRQLGRRAGVRGARSAVQSLDPQDPKRPLHSPLAHRLRLDRGALLPGRPAARAACSRRTSAPGRRIQRRARGRQLLHSRQRLGAELPARPGAGDVAGAGPLGDGRARERLRAARRDGRVSKPPGAVRARRRAATARGDGAARRQATPGGVRRARVRARPRAQSGVRHRRPAVQVLVTDRPAERVRLRHGPTDPRAAEARGDPRRLRARRAMPRSASSSPRPTAPRCRSRSCIAPRSCATGAVRCCCTATGRTA